MHGGIKKAQKKIVHGRGHQNFFGSARVEKAELYAAKIEKKLHFAVGFQFLLLYW